MKRVFVHAYLAGNLGDDLFVRMLCERYPKVRFYIYADASYKVRFGDILNCRVNSPGDRRVRLAERWMQRLGIEGGWRRLLIRCSDAVVHIGGSVFVQHYDDWSEFYRVDDSLQKESRRLYVVGANFGPYVNPAYQEQYHELFKKYRGICFRDTYSRNLFADLANVSYAPDLIFSYPAKPCVPKKKKVVVSLIELDNRTGKYAIDQYAGEYLDFHVKLVSVLIKRGYAVTLVSFCQSQMDDQMIQKVCDRLKESEKSQITCMAYQNDVRPIVKEFEESEAVVGTRFHSVILGMLCRCKVLPVVYDQKTRRTLDDLQYAKKLELSELEDQDVDESIESLLSMEPYDVRQLVRDSEGQFRYVDRFLKRGKVAK